MNSYHTTPAIYIMIVSYHHQTWTLILI